MALPQYAIYICYIKKNVELEQYCNEYIKNVELEQYCNEYI